MKTDSAIHRVPPLRYVTDLEACLHKEWLLTNGRGGYASGTLAGVPTRKYHGLLVAAARPPLQRWMMLSAVVERISVCGRKHELSSFQFDRTVHPHGYEYLSNFQFSNEPANAWVRYVYEHDGLQLTREISVPRGSNEVVIRYSFEGPPGEPISLELLPLTPMRDYHSVTRAFPGNYSISELRDFVAVDAYSDGPRLWLGAEQTNGGSGVAFHRKPEWWYGFVYREEAERGLDAREDLFVPGSFEATGEGSIEVTFRAVAAFGEQMNEFPEPLVDAAAPRRSSRPISIEERLRHAGDAFIVRRSCDRAGELTTILAGYPWFGDWGRDTFIALPGLLLETSRFAEARQVLEVFASSEKDGLIPNRFSDYGDGRDYNSADASLWFIHASDAYCERSGDEAAWNETLGSTCARIIDAYVNGTRFNIRMEPDGLVTCGDSTTQLTWMDAKCNEIVFTPRHGKPVEVNALWYHALCVMARRMEAGDQARATRCRELAARVRQSFLGTFWNENTGCLFDVVRDNWRDLAIRPNQILAVSLPDSPLDGDKQRCVLAMVQRELLTPYGLRSLSPQHPSFRGQYRGTPYERDSVYHQGTVWAWLIGPYVEAYLRVHGFSAKAKSDMREAIMPLIRHLDEAGLGSISEIFDGNPPFAPRGCIAQAWSVAEVLRAWRLTEPDMA